MRRAAAIGLAALLLATSVSLLEGATRLYRASVIRCTNATGGVSLFPGGPRRAQVRLMNLGTATVWIGQQDGTLTTATGWPVHAAALAGNIVLRDTAAGMNCLTADIDSVQVGVMEELE